MHKNNHKAKVDQHTEEKSGHFTHKRCGKHCRDYERQRPLSGVEVKSIWSKEAEEARQNFQGLLIFEIKKNLNTMEMNKEKKPWPLCPYTSMRSVTKKHRS